MFRWEQLDSAGIIIWAICNLRLDGLLLHLDGVGLFCAKRGGLGLRNTLLKKDGGYDILWPLGESCAIYRRPVCRRLKTFFMRVCASRGAWGGLPWKKIVHTTYSG